MTWIKKSDRLPTSEDGFRVRTFSPTYAKSNSMRHRIMDYQFVKICDDVTHWKSIDEPGECNLNKIEEIVKILKRFEQIDYKNGGVSLAPEMYNAVARQIIDMHNNTTVDRFGTLL